MSRFIITQKTVAANDLALPEGPWPDHIRQAQQFNGLNGQTQMDLLLESLGTLLVIFDSLCICLFAFVRVLLNIVRVSFTCKDINAEV